MQVVGRVVMIFAERHVSMYTVCATTFISMLLGIGALIYAGARQELVFLFVILHGAGYGVTSITRPVVTAGLLGKENFGAISGAIALCFMSGFALSPLLAAKIWEWGGLRSGAENHLHHGFCGTAFLPHGVVDNPSVCHPYVKTTVIKNLNQKNSPLKK